jgi:hypothetical protein
MPKIRELKTLRNYNQFFRSYIKNMNHNHKRNTHRSLSLSPSTSKNREAAERIERHIRNELTESGKKSFNTKKTKRTYQQLKRLEILSKMKSRKGTAI